MFVVYFFLCVWVGIIVVLVFVVFFVYLMVFRFGLSDFIKILEVICEVFFLVRLGVFDMK